jgi:hypothetical protein
MKWLLLDKLDCSKLLIMIKAFGRLRSARRVDDDKSSLPPIPGSSVQEKWENAISTVVSKRSHFCF